MKFYKPEDLTDENFEKSWEIIEELSKKAKESSRLLCESAKPQFNTTEELLQYYNAIPFSEWENKMREKYVIIK